MSLSGCYRILQFPGLMGISPGNFDPARLAKCAKDPHSEIDDIRPGFVIASPDVLPGHCSRRRHRNDHHRGPRGCLPRTGLCGAPMI